MGRVVAIVRVNSKALEAEIPDLDRLSSIGYHGLSFKIPTVRVLRRKLNGGYGFTMKPLLFNYGFVYIDVNYVRNPIILNNIRKHSKLIQGFFYRNEDDLKLERKMKEKEGLKGYLPVLVKTVKENEVDRLFEVARNLDVYDKTSPVETGSFIILKGYPFDGLSARVIRSKINGKVQVELLESNLQVWLEPDNIYYSVYEDSELE